VNNLVGGFNPSEKYEFVSWDYYSQYMGKKSCAKPPTKQFLLEMKKSIINLHQQVDIYLNILDFFIIFGGYRMI
jgi:hypothetical protein